MFNKLREKLRAGDKEKRKTSEASAFDSENVTNAAYVKQASLIQLNVIIDVYIGDIAGTYKAPLSKFLASGLDSNASSNYSFDQFVSVFGEKIYPAVPDSLSLMLNGKLNYDANTRDMGLVWDQDSFAVAINTLYLNRGKTGDLVFIYQPEVDIQREERIAAEIETGRKGVAQMLPILPPRALISGDNAGRSTSLPTARLGNMIPCRPAKRNSPMGDGASFQTNPKHADAKLEDLDKSNTAVSSPVSPFTVKEPRRAASNPVLTAQETAITRVVSNQQSIASHTKSSSSVKNAIRKIAHLPGKTEPESKEDEQKRFKTLYSVVNKVSYTRGGDEGDLSPEDVQRFEEADHDTNDGEADEEPEKTEEEGEDDEISNEDRIVTK